MIEKGAGMFRVFRRIVLLWIVCVSVAVYVAPEIPRQHLKKYLSANQRPQYEYENGQIPAGVQFATLALNAIEHYVPSKTDPAVIARGGMSNPQEAFFKSSAEATPAEFVEQWREQYVETPKSTVNRSYQVGPAVQVNPFAR